MRMMDELKHLFLYSADKKVYAPIDMKDKRRNSAILLLSPNMESSLQMTRLPYMCNPNLFYSFYIDRNVGAYIDNVGEDNIDFDEQEAETVSESMIHWTSKTKFKFDDHTSMMDENYIKEVFNHEVVSYYAKMLKLNRVPDKFKVVVHPNLTDLRKNAPKQISNICKENFYSYTTQDNTIHLLSKMAYDPYSMRGFYDIYLKSELIYALMIAYNNNLPFVPARSIAHAIAGLEEWMDKETRNTIEKNDIIKFIHAINIMKNKHGLKPIHEFIKTADINTFTRYTLKNAASAMSKLIFESELSYFERQRLLPSDFGVPDKRKYPIHDEAHVRAAVRMFNNCDPSDEEELAAAIIKRMKKFGINDIKVSASNRFRKYYKPESNKNESAVLNEKYMSLNSYNNEILCSKNMHNEFEELKDVKFGDKRFGEIFTDNDGKLIAFYMSYKDDDDNVWITDLETAKGYEDAYTYLIDRAIDRQDAMYVSVNKNDSDKHNLYKKYGFKEYDTDNDNYLMTIDESSIDNNYGDILKICNSLSNDELKRITFYDTYRDSQFIIKRIVCKVGFEPAGFLDVYHFPSNPEIAQIVIAVDNRFRGMGVAQSMVSEMLNAELHKNHKFKMYYWTAHGDNYASQNLAMKNGFIDTNTIDKYGRKVFIKKVAPSIKEEIVKEVMSIGNTDNRSLITENAGFFLEADNTAYSLKLRKYLYSERIKSNKEVTLLYDRVRESNPNLRKMYLKIKMYKKQNVFIDLSYYHALFLKNNIYTMDRAVNLYFEFLNRLINNKEIDDEYSKKTIFIPIDTGTWNIQPGTDLLDFKKNLNPISMICRLVRTNLAGLRKAWGNKDIIFVGSRGYFTIDFNKFDIKDISRLRVNLRKLMSTNEVIRDDYENDTIADDDSEVIKGYGTSTTNSDTSKGMAIRIIDKIEQEADIKINDVSSLGSTQSKQSNGTFIQSPHLRISNSLDIDKKAIEKNNGIVVITLDPDGPNGFNRFSKTPLSKIDCTISSYCLPK